MKTLTTFSKKSLLGGVHYSNAMSGKMQGIGVLTTSCTSNPHCLALSKDPNNICHECYAFGLLNKVRKNCKPIFEENGKILSSSLLCCDFIPTITYNDFRFEAYGDILNETHFINYVNIAKKNPQTQCTLFTKRPIVISHAIATNDIEIPENMNIVLSMPRINDIPSEQKIRDLKELFPFVTTIFAVVTKEYAKENNIEITCGARSCATCRRCYKKTNKEDIQLIVEQLKKR